MKSIQARIIDGGQRVDITITSDELANVYGIANPDFVCDVWKQRFFGKSPFFGAREFLDNEIHDVSNGTKGAHSNGN